MQLLQAPVKPEVVLLDLFVLLVGHLLETLEANISKVFILGGLEAQNLWTFIAASAKRPCATLVAILNHTSDP